MLAPALAVPPRFFDVTTFGDRAVLVWTRGGVTGLEMADLDLLTGWPIRSYDWDIDIQDVSVAVDAAGKLVIGGNRGADTAGSTGGATVMRAEGDLVPLETPAAALVTGAFALGAVGDPFRVAVNGPAFTVGYIDLSAPGGNRRARAVFGTCPAIN